MTVSIVRLYNSKGPDRSAIVAVEPASGAIGFLIRLARGTGPGPLRKGGVFGPFAEDEVSARFAEIVAGLQAEGFLPTGVHDLLLRLDSPLASVRARAALSLGWRRAHEAVEPILARLPKAVDEVCSYLDALGMIGDKRAVPVLREQAARKLLSRRRSAVEALRNLGDADGLATARQQALERLPESVRSLVDGDAVTLAAAVHALEPAQRGLALDTLYELATPIAVESLRTVLATLPFDQPNSWRYVKSIYKRAMLRQDPVTFAWLSHEIEVRARNSAGIQATVKSGYDGVARSVRIFGRATQNFMRRLAWRYLRSLAIHRPDAYAHAAAEALCAYVPEDAAKPKGLFGAFASCYLLTRILWDRSDRLHYMKRTLRFRFRSAQTTEPSATRREEAYPERWDAEPRAYLRVLASARLSEAQDFALRGIQRHPMVLHAACHAQILNLLHADYEPTLLLGLSELQRRFDSKEPDWVLLTQLLSDARPRARELGERWLRETASLWTRDVERSMAWLSLPQPSARLLAVELLSAHLPGDAVTRAVLAERILQKFLEGSLTNDDADGFAEVARRALLDEITPRLTLAQLLAWIDKGPTVALAVAGALLGRRTETLADFDFEALAALAQHDVAAIRAGAHVLLRRGEAHLQTHPAILFVLVESIWDDTRALAIELLRRVLEGQTLGFDTLLGLLDSSQIDVQNFGIERTRRELQSLPVSRLVFRLVQHPHPNMRRFALELAQHHLPDGAEPLARLETFLRSIFFDLRPDRRLKQQALDFLMMRGLRDETQARVAASILAEVARAQGRSDFERALEGLVRLQLAFPEVPTGVQLAMEEVQ